MALKATMTIGGKNYSLVDYKWKVASHHNESRPDSMARCAFLEVTVETPGMENLSLMNWYVAQSSQDGTIQIQMEDVTGDPIKEVKFGSAICYAIAETYHIDKYAKRALRLSLAVESLTVDNIVFTAEL